MTFKLSFLNFITFIFVLCFISDRFSKAEDTPIKVWNVRCNEANGKCEVFQRYIIKETGQRIIEFAIGYPKNGKGGIGVIILPLGIRVDQPVQIKMGDKQYQEFDIESCSQDGCFSSIKIDQNFINALQGNNKISFVFNNLSGQIINVEMATEGFTKAFLEAFQK